MKLLPAAVQTWFDELAARERRLVLIGGAVLGLLVIYLAVVQPMVHSRTRSLQELQQRQKLLSYMNSVAPRLRARQASPGVAPGVNGGSVFAVVSAAAQKNSAISGAVTRLEQAGNGSVRVNLSGASFDALVQWLGTLQEHQGIVVTNANIQRADDPGTVNATLTLSSS